MEACECDCQEESVIMLTHIEMVKQQFQSEDVNARFLSMTMFPCIFFIPFKVM